MGAKRGMPEASLKKVTEERPLGHFSKGDNTSSCLLLLTTIHQI